MRLLGVCMQPAEFEQQGNARQCTLAAYHINGAAWVVQREGGGMSEGLHALHGVWGAREDSPHT
jgi:hypothetical protein